MSPSNSERLRERRQALAELSEPPEWADISAWVARTLPLIQKEYSAYLGNFTELVKEPRWVSGIYVSRTDRAGLGTDNYAEVEAISCDANARIASDVRRKILSFLDGLLDLVSEADSSLAKSPAANELRSMDITRRATLGILTALPKECAAIRLMLHNEERWSAPGEGGGRDYYIGEIPAEGGGNHLVVVALLPDMGNNSAAISAMRLLHHFPEVRHIIMCGIAGGVPKPGDVEHDVRLGDIVVSNRNGVVQYDLIKEKPDGTKEHRHPPRPPSAELLSAVRHLFTEEEMGSRPWEKFLPLGAKMKNGQRPADNLDARGMSIDYPADRERRPGLPRVFQGPIAAANVLLKHPAHRDYLSDKFGVKAVEMEGAGVADATWTNGAGYLVVRGICDYCDGIKGDVWQGAAAIAAAAYVRALVGSMRLDPATQNVRVEANAEDPQ